MIQWFPRGEFVVADKSSRSVLSRVESAFDSLKRQSPPLPLAWERLQKGEKNGFSFHAMRRTATKCPWLVVKATVEETPDGVRCTYRTHYSAISLFLFFGEGVIFLLFPIQVLVSYLLGWRFSFAWWEYGVALLSPAVWYWLIQNGRADAERAMDEIRNRVGG